MPSRADTSFLPTFINDAEPWEFVSCQCPLGLIPHFYPTKDYSNWGMTKVSMPSRADTSFLHTKCGLEFKVVNGCQCPLGLIPHFYTEKAKKECAFCTVSMPSRADTSFLLPTTISTWTRHLPSVNALSG